MTDLQLLSRQLARCIMDLSQTIADRFAGLDNRTKALEELIVRTASFENRIAELERWRNGEDAWHAQLNQGANESLKRLEEFKRTAQ